MTILMRKLSCTLPVIVLFFLFCILSLLCPEKQYASCPGSKDAHAYTDGSGNTYSDHPGVGFNTKWKGSTGQCGPINTNSKQTCFTKINGSCYAGIGVSGFSVTGCTAIDTNSPISCFSTMDLHMQVVDNSGKGVPNITLTIKYEGKHDTPEQTATATTDSNGNATLANKLYPGDHYVIIAPTNAGYSFNPTQHGDFTNVGHDEMDTTWSCGTPVNDGNGTINSPCKFTGTLLSTPTPTLTPTPTPTPNPCGRSISGIFFNDTNHNYKYDAGEPTLANQTIQLKNVSTGVQTSITTPASGVYSFTNLCGGSYTISDTTPIPSGYIIEYPQGSPPTVTATVGPACSVPPTSGASCDVNGNVINLGFSLTNSLSWYQALCSDIRQESNGGINNNVPSTASCGGKATPNMIMNDAGNAVCTNGPGVAFSGNSNPSFGQGQASANPYNWQVGNTQYPETFSSVNPTVIRTSYSYMQTTARQAGITPTDLSTSCTGGINTCTLSAGLPRGLYQTFGNAGSISDGFGSLTLVGAGYTFGTVANPQNYVILVNGTLTMKEPIHVAAGSTVTFSVSGDIHVDPSVGETIATSLASDVEGLYSTDKSFYVDTAGTPGASCKADSSPIDKKLNVQGSIVVNAGKTGGTFQNNRDLCSSNPSCPTFTITMRPDMLLNAPQFIKHQQTLWQEVVP